MERDPEANMKFKTPEKRREMWDALIKHVSEGYSLQSFPVCDEDTFYKYGREYPEECPIAELNDAKRKSCFFWEKIGVAGATGKLDGFNAASWIFNMKNRFNWADKVENYNANADINTAEPSDVDKQILARYGIGADKPKEK